MCEKCNGWKNYETWNVKLWLDNEQSTQEHVLTLARAVRDEHEDADDARSALEDNIQDYVMEFLPELLGFDMSTVPMMYGDLLTAALGEVDWYEIAGAYLEDI